MYRDDVATFGPHMSARGYIAELGESRFGHRFGGEAWSVDRSAPHVLGDSTLLLTLDLVDPKLSALRMRGLASIPLASDINSSAWEGRQVYSINSEERTLTLIEREIASIEHLPPELQFPDPIPEKTLQLRQMDPSEVPVDEESYWRVGEQFIGGPGFIRILGAPLWLQWVEEHACPCGRMMEYVASIGHESLARPSGFLDARPFFIGEGALYFFLCRACRSIAVSSQST